MKSIFLSTFFLTLSLHLFAQPQSQIIRGMITDKITEQPLAGATISVEGTAQVAQADEKGRFFISNVPVGRIRVTISFSGYQSATIPEILVTSGKEVVLDIALEQQVAILSEVQISSSKVKKGNVSNEFAGNSARSFNIEEVTRYAGGRNDPSKLVSNFAGVISNNDSRNDIVVRGNSPAGVLWRIEGLPAPSPNHYATLGTTGGPISALNTNALKTSDFYSGAFPAEYGNATAAVFDISFRAGNTNKHERTLQVNLFSGLEVMLEGPLNKKKNGASYLAGYRYSFVQIGQSLGLDVGTAAVPKYQDWVYHIQLAPSKAGKFSFFGMGGKSNIDFIGQEIDTTDFYSRKDQDSYFSNRLLMFGAKHSIDLGKKTYWRTVVSYSNTKSDFETYQYALPVPPYGTAWKVTDVLDQQDVIRFSSLLNSKTSVKFSWRAGLTGESFGLDTRVTDRQGQNSTAPFNLVRDFDDRFLLLQLFGQFRYKPSSKLTLIGGVHGMNFSFNQSSIIEPRASVQYQANPKNSFSISYGLHGQLQPLPVYLYEKSDGFNTDRSNRSLGFSRAHHLVLGYENRFATDWRLKAEWYYQSLFDIPVEKTASGFSMINAGSDFTFPEKAGLVNNGKGRNTGIELSIEKFLSHGFYLLSTGSVFRSKYKGSDGIERNSSYNYGYAANLLAGKEWKTGHEKRNAFTLDIRLSMIGGRYATPIDITASLAAGKEVLDESNYNATKLSGYLRADTKFGFRLNSRKRKMSQTIYLDLQNVTNRENIFLRRFNPVYGTVGNVNQIGFFPDILYRIQF